MSNTTPAQRAAYDAAAATVRRQHRWDTNDETLLARCVCGVTAGVYDIAQHVNDLASDAGYAAMHRVSATCA